MNIKENQISQVKEISVYGKMQEFLRGDESLGSLKSFLSYASQLSWASILCFFTFWAPLNSLQGKATYSLLAVG